MRTKTQLIAVSLCVFGIAACSKSNEYWGAGQSNQKAAIQLYPDGYDNGGAYAPANAEVKQVVVPETYHVREATPQQAFKSRDINWVNNQNPQGYTIELASGSQAASVNATLQKAPRTERMAAVKVKQNGQDSYQGIYGTFSSQEAAQAALNKLPEELKQNASIKSWHSVQSQVNE
jgi:septal ring-binding cell division protein DamX